MVDVTSNRHLIGNYTLIQGLETLDNVSDCYSIPIEILRKEIEPVFKKDITDKKGIYVEFKPNKVIRIFNLDGVIWMQLGYKTKSGKFKLYSSVKDGKFGNWFLAIRNNG